MAQVAPNEQPKVARWPSTAMKRLVKSRSPSSSTSSTSTPPKSGGSFLIKERRSSGSSAKSSSKASSDNKLTLTFKKSKRKEAVKKLIRAFEPELSDSEDTEPPYRTTWIEQARWETSVQAVYPIFEHDFPP